MCLGAQLAPTAAQAQVPVVAWNANAVSYRGQIGRPITVVCTPGGPLGSAWGTDLYSDDSSICTAAVHAGRLALAAGGQVTIYMQPGQASYAGSPRNGVTTSSYGQWSGSFSFTPVVAGVVATPTPPPQSAGTPIAWNGTATQYRGQNGTQLTFSCPPGGTASTVWGSGPYTDDSSICTAAVHAGRINFATGGTVSITIMPGLGRYRAGTANGVTTMRYPRFSGSFRVN